MVSPLARVLHSRPQSAVFLRLLACGSGVTLAAALVAQFVFHLAPCHLCLLQRWPYVGIILLGVWGGWFEKKQSRRRALLVLCILALLGGLSIAGYHAGVEAGIFPGPDSCSSQSTGGETLEEMRRAIMEAPIVSCDQPLGKVFGLSLAVWSALIYSFLTILAFSGYYRANRLDAKA